MYCVVCVRWGTCACLYASMYIIVMHHLTFLIPPPPFYCHVLCKVFRAFKDLCLKDIPYYYYYYSYSVLMQYFTKFLLHDLFDREGQQAEGRQEGGGHRDQQLQNGEGAPVQGI